MGRRSLRMVELGLVFTFHRDIIKANWVKKNRENQWLRQGGSNMSPCTLQQLALISWQLLNS